MRSFKIFVIIVCVTVLSYICLSFLSPSQSVIEKPIGSKEYLSLLPKVLPNNAPVIAVIVPSCDRVSIYRLIIQLLNYRPSVDQFPIIVSQDCDHKETENMVLAFKKYISILRHPVQHFDNLPSSQTKFVGYYKVASHYGWMLNMVFKQFNFTHAIIVEDDLEISQDFFEYFLGTLWLMNTDPSIWCISAWNDNGHPNLIDINQPELLYRTDFFPGLGWMLTNQVWDQLNTRDWPPAFWDDWIRGIMVQEEKACIRPEVPRTKTSGRWGVSKGMFFKKYLSKIKVYEGYVEFSKLNLSYLLKTNYDDLFFGQAYLTHSVHYWHTNFNPLTAKWRYDYKNEIDFVDAAQYVGLMEDIRFGMPRTAYKGIVTFFKNGKRGYLTPALPWKGYKQNTWLPAVKNNTSVIMKSY